MSSLVKEIFEPVKSFYAMRKNRKSELFTFILLPVIIGITLFVLEIFLTPIREVNIEEFSNDLLNILITVLTLFVSFSMAYLSIIVTSDSKSINIMKETKSKYYCIGLNQCTLYQVLTTDITYTLVLEIIFLLFTFFQKFLVYMVNDLGIKILIAVNMALIVHVFILLMLTIKNIYLAFWQG